MTFEQLHLHPAILKALTECGYTAPTPIQEQAIPEALAGHDLIASAQTGTGKTAAFMLPAIHRVTQPAKARGRGPRVLVLTPTRELANQIREAVQKYTRHLPQVRAFEILGGVPYPKQIKALSQPVDILVATPGRLLDHLERGRVDFSRLEMLVLDEADRMLDMGFIDAVEQIAQATPKTRQTLLFSATLEGSIAKLAQRLLKDPKRIQISSAQARHENITQRLHFVDNAVHKHQVLHHLLSDAAMEKAIVFTATKRGADELAQKLFAAGLPAAALHGDMNQAARTRTVQRLRTGKLKLLVATDVAARGIDINGISHVINFDMPKFAEDYVHRIGRTGRAGASGIAISLATRGEIKQLRSIERYTKQRVEPAVIPGLEPKAPVRADEPGTARRRPNGPSGPGGRTYGPRPTGPRRPAESRPNGPRPAYGRDNQPRAGDRARSSDWRAERPLGERSDRPQTGNIRSDSRVTVKRSVGARSRSTYPSRTLLES